jgi:hypothetical protein
MTYSRTTRDPQKNSVRPSEICMYRVHQIRKMLTKKRFFAINYKNLNV